MKSTFLKVCILTTLSSVALQAENLVVNGDFETGSGTAFYASPPWYNCGTGFNQGASARSDKGAIIEGSYSAIINDRYLTAENKSGPLTHVQKTQHTIQEGDSFALSYDWRPADDYWQRSTDTVRFVLYATANDKVGGPMVWSSELTSKFFQGKLNTVMSVSETTEVVNSDAVGRIFFVMFYGMDIASSGTDSTPHWARVDSIEVQAVNDKKKP